MEGYLGARESLMTLPHLPTDVILLVASHLQKPDLSRLSRSCRGLHDLLNKEIYKTIHWRWNDPGSPLLNVLSSPPIHLLARSLADNASLRNKVENVHFDGSRVESSTGTSATIWEPNNAKGLSAVDLDCFMQHSRDLPFNPTATFSEAVANGNIDAYVTLVLVFCPKIVSLKLDWAFTFSERSLGRNLWHSIQSAPHPGLQCFESLRKAHLRRESHYYSNQVEDAPFEYFYSYFYLPSLEELIIELPRIRTFSWPDLARRAPMSSLTSLTLNNCEANEYALEGLLARQPLLRTFVYDYYCAEPASYDRGYFFNLTVLSHALDHVAITLESLTLAFHHLGIDADDWPCYRAGGFFTGSLAPFSKFGKLRYLETGLATLFGDRLEVHEEGFVASMLPRSLHHLCVTENLMTWAIYLDVWETEQVVGQLRGVFLWKRRAQSARNEQLSDGLQIIEIQRGSVLLEWKKEEKVEVDRLAEQHSVHVLWSQGPIYHP